MKRIRKEHKAIILFYHRFSSGENGEYILPRLDIREFERQIIHLRKYYRVISMDELAEVAREQKHFSRPSIAITLDDGYLDNYQLAFPILHRNKVPGTIYLTVGCMDGPGNIWIDTIEDILMLTREKTLTLKDMGDAILAIEDRDGKRKAESLLYGKMRQMENSGRKKALDHLCALLKVEPEQINASPRKMLNWEEIKEMAQAGISFGAHTVTHGFLPGMPLDEAQWEIRESKEKIERILGCRIRHFAIPNGKTDDFSGDLTEFCKDIGFETVVTTESGAVKPADDRYSLKRILPPPPIYYFACETAREFFLNK